MHSQKTLSKRTNFLYQSSPCFAQTECVSLQKRCDFAETEALEQSEKSTEEDDDAHLAPLPVWRPQVSESQ